MKIDQDKTQLDLAAAATKIKEPPKTPEQKAKEEKERHMLLDYVKTGRVEKEIKIACLIFQIQTRLLNEDFLVEKVANDESFNMHQMNVLGAAISITSMAEVDDTGKKITEKNYPPIDFDKMSYDDQKEQVLTRFKFFLKRGSGIPDAISRASLKLESIVRDLVDAAALKNL